MNRLTRLGQIFAAIFIFGLSACFDSGVEDEAAEDAGAEETGSSSSSKADRDAIRARVTELRAQKKALEAKVKELEGAAGKKDEIVKEEISVMSELDESRAYAARFREFRTRLTADLEVWRGATRASFAGVQLPEIVTVDGRRFAQVTIVSVDDENLSFTHGGGTESLPITQLPVGLRRNLIHEDTVTAERGL